MASSINGDGVEATTRTAYKVRENRARRAAARQGLTLARSRARDPRSLTFGLYWLSNAAGRRVTPESGVTLDRIEKYLRGEK